MITPEQFEQVCVLTEGSTKSQKTICKELKFSNGSVSDYINKVGSKAENRYARAKQIQIEIICDEIHELLNECWIEINSCEDTRKTNAIVQFYKLKIDTLKWLLSKLIPKKYGDKIEVDNNHNFPDGIKINFTRGDRKQKLKKKNKSDDQQS